MDWNGETVLQWVMRLQGLANTDTLLMPIMWESQMGTLKEQLDGG
jgi:hypothetical protein